MSSSSAIEPGKPSDRTYALFICKSLDSKFNLWHKIVSAALSTFFFVFYAVYYDNWEYHKYLTTVGMDITLVCRWVVLIHHLAKVKDDHWLTDLCHLAQTTHWNWENIIFLFYWAVLAAHDVPSRDTFGKHLINIYNHVFCTILGFIPVVTERTKFTWKQFWFFNFPLITAYAGFLFLSNEFRGDPVYTMAAWRTVADFAYIVGMMLAIIAMHYVGHYTSLYFENKFRTKYGLPKYTDKRLCCCQPGKKLSQIAQATQLRENERVDFAQRFTRHSHSPIPEVNIAEPQVIRIDANSAVNHHENEIDDHQGGVNTKAAVSPQESTQNLISKAFPPEPTPQDPEVKISSPEKSNQPSQNFRN